MPNSAELTVACKEMPERHPIHSTELFTIYEGIMETKDKVYRVAIKRQNLRSDRTKAKYAEVSSKTRLNDGRVPEIGISSG